MGQQVEIAIHLDEFDQIRRRPRKFVKLLWNAIQQVGRTRTSYGFGNCGNCITILPTHSSEDFKVYFNDRGSFQDAGEYAVEQFVREHPAEWQLELVEKNLRSVIRRAEESLAYVREVQAAAPEDRPGGANSTRESDEELHHRAFRARSASDAS